MDDRITTCLFLNPQHIVDTTGALLQIGGRGSIDFEHQALIVQDEDTELPLELRELHVLRLELKRVLRPEHHELRLLHLELEPYFVSSLL